MAASGVQVRFTVHSGGGSLLDEGAATTNAAGIASTLWKLGKSGAQIVSASCHTLPGQAVQFHAVLLYNAAPIIRVTRDTTITEMQTLNRYTSDKPSWFYEVVAPGFKYNLTDIAAAIGIHQLRKANLFHKCRTEMAAKYDAALEDLPIILPPKARLQDQHAWHLYVIRLAENATVRRDRFIELMAEKGIGCSVHFIPLHLHPYWRDKYNLKPNDFPHAFKAYKSAISLPLYTKMRPEDQERVIRTVREILTIP